jgi:hypothetical protein
MGGDYDLMTLAPSRSVLSFCSTTLAIPGLWDGCD